MIEDCFDSIQDMARHLLAHCMEGIHVMNEKEKTSASRFISLILRHDPQKIDITLEHDGWADTDALLEGMNRAGYRVSLEELKEIVTTNNKQRFKFSDDYTKIRANQGHSVNVDVDLKEIEPPSVLYHGTATKYVQSIKNEGLISKSRLHVHLSSDKETAAKVGARHGKAVVLTIDSARMSKNGFKFYLSDNNVWLTNAVPVELARNRACRRKAELRLRYRAIPPQ